MGTKRQSRAGRASLCGATGAGGLSRRRWHPGERDGVAADTDYPVVEGGAESGVVGGSNLGRGGIIGSDAVDDLPAIGTTLKVHGDGAAGVRGQTGVGGRIRRAVGIE